MSYWDVIVCTLKSWLTVVVYMKMSVTHVSNNKPTIYGLIWLYDSWSKSFIRPCPGIDPFPTTIPKLSVTRAQISHHQFCRICPSCMYELNLSISLVLMFSCHPMLYVKPNQIGSVVQYFHTCMQLLFSSCMCVYVWYVLFVYVRFKYEQHMDRWNHSVVMV